MRNHTKRLTSKAQEGAKSGATAALHDSETQKNARQAALKGAKQGYQDEGSARGAVKGALKGATQSVAHDVGVGAAKGAITRVGEKLITIALDEETETKSIPIKKPDTNRSPAPKLLASNTPPKPLPTWEGLNEAPHKFTYLNSKYRDNVPGWSLATELVKQKDWDTVLKYLELLDELEPNNIETRSQYLNQAHFLQQMAQSNIAPSVLFYLLDNFNLPPYFIKKIAQTPGLKAALKNHILTEIIMEPAEKQKLIEDCTIPTTTLGQFFLSERNLFNFPWHTTTKTVKQFKAKLTSPTQPAVPSVSIDELETRESFSGMTNPAIR